MPINLISKVKPKNDGYFPTVEDIDIHGGYQVRTDLTDRNNIPSLNRKEGMLVYTQSDAKYYTLSGGLTDGYWTEVSFGGSSISYVFIENEDRTVASGSSELIISSNTDSIIRTITLPASPIVKQEIIILRDPPFASNTLIIDFNFVPMDNQKPLFLYTFVKNYLDVLHIIYSGSQWIHIYSKHAYYSPPDSPPDS